MAKPAQQRAERLHQYGASVHQFGPVRARKAGELSLAGWRELDTNLAAIHIPSHSLYQLPFRQSVSQSNRAVMAYQKGRSNVPDQRAVRIVESAHGQQELMLLRFQPLHMRRSLTEMHEAADLKTEVRQGAIFGISQFFNVLLRSRLIC